MDIDEEGAPDAATACKRQKRDDSSDESCNAADSEAGTSSAAGETAAGTTAAAAPQTSNANNDSMSICLTAENRKEENRHNNNNNNSSDKDDNIDTDKQQCTVVAVAATEAAAAASALKSPIVIENISPRSPGNVDDLELDIHTVSNTPSSSPLVEESGIGVDQSSADVNTDDGHDDMVPIFIRPRTFRTRSYRSTLSESLTSSNSNSSTEQQPGDHPSDAHNSDTNDTEVDGDGDGDGDGTDEIVVANNVDYESHSPVGPFPEETSSDSSDIFLHRYYGSSHEEVDSDDVETNLADKEQVEIAVNKIMCKSKPSYSWNCVQELMHREHNFHNRIGWRGGHTSALSFGQGYYGSRQVIERMKVLNILSRHRGCVNSLNFNRSGDLVCSGSDDLLIVVWDWANGKARHSFKSGHSLNIFQTKFIDSAGCLDIVSSSRDGQVRRAVIPPSGSSSFRPMRLYTHNAAVHKIVVVPQSHHEIMSAGEDAAVKHYDLRTNTATTMLRNVGDKRSVRLFSIAHHPYGSEFCVSGSDDKLRIYDKRKLNKTVHEMMPKDLKDTKVTQVTCAVYNHSGSEILASYSDAGIYLYDTRNYKDNEFLHSYEGHINSRTIKGVNFFGPNSEYIVSGSDCGHIFFWDKNTESVINFVKGDSSGVVNCLEPHPWMPVLATSGLEHKVKIWTPTGLPEAEEPSSDALKETLQRNFRRNILDVGDFDISQIHYFIRQLVGNTGGGSSQGTAERNRYNFSNSSDSSSSSSNSSSRSSTSPTLPTASITSAERRQRDRERDRERQRERQRERERERERELDASNVSSSDEGNADPLTCRTQ